MVAKKKKKSQTILNTSTFKFHNIYKNNFAVYSNFNILFRLLDLKMFFKYPRKLIYFCYILICHDNYAIILNGVLYNMFV